MKKGLLLLTIIVLIACAAAPVEAARKKSTPNNRYASIVIDAATGTVLSERYADKPLYPASLTKMMTLYLTFEALHNGTMRKYDRISVSSRAAGQEPSKLDLKSGQTIKVEDAIYALVTKSANDVAVVLGEAVGGSEARFAKLMTHRARQLGMVNTTFRNASGLHDPAQRSTARDMAILSQALIRDFPREYRYFSTPSFTYAGTTYVSHNKLMKTYPGMDGLKTGYIHASGYNLAASAVRDGRRLIGVVFGGRTSLSRNSHMKEILDTGFDRVKAPLVAARIREKESRMTASVLPERKPVQLAANDDTPAFPPLGLSTDEQGDTGEPQSIAQLVARYAAPRNGAATAQDNAPDFAPRPINTAKMSAGGWAVQIGAFSSHESSMAALRGVRRQLPSDLIAQTTDLVVPLMTNRGMIYRARLSGLNQAQATQACRVLQGSCLILAAH